MDLGPASKRRRPAVACTQCRRRKIRCDRASPCGSCSKSPLSSLCIYNTDPMPTSNIENRGVHVRNGSLTQLGQCQSDLGAGLLDQNPQDLDLLLLDMMPLYDDTEVDMDYFGLGGYHLKKSSTDSSNSMFCGASHTGISTSISSTSASSSSVFELHLPGDHKCTEQQNQWYDAFAHCEKLRFLLPTTPRHPFNGHLPLQPGYEALRPLLETFVGLDQAAQHEHEHENDRELERRPFTPTWPAPSFSILGAARDLLPPRQTCDVLLNSYINTFETVLRILHVPSFLQDYNRFWERLDMNSKSAPRSTGGDLDESFVCKLLITIAIGSYTCTIPGNGESRGSNSESDLERADSDDLNADADSHHDAASLREQAHGWIGSAKQWLVQNMVSWSRAEIDMVQIGCLLALARHTQYHFHPAASTGTAWLPGDYDLTRIGMQMGLHREPRVRSPFMSTKDAEIRRRLWATMLELEMQQSLDEGMPAPLASESYDCEAPSSVTDEDINMEFGYSSPGFTATSILVLLSRTQRLRLRVLQLVNAPGASKAYDESHRLAAELTAICSADLHMLRSMKHPQPTDFQVKLLEIFTRPFVLALHGPFADQASTKPEYFYSRRMRMEVSALLLTQSDPPLLMPAPRKSSRSTKTTTKTVTITTTTTTTTMTPPSAKVIAGTISDRDAYTALRIYGHGHFALVQRQATVALCLDLISELEENTFPISDSSLRQKLGEVLRSVVGIFNRRMRAAYGAHSAREFLLFTCAAAYIEALQQGCQSGEIDEKILVAAREALAVCCEVMGERKQVAGIDEGLDDMDSQMWMHGDDGLGSMDDGGLDFQGLTFPQAFYNPGRS